MRLLRLSSLLMMNLAVAACSGNSPGDDTDLEGGGKADSDGDGVPDDLPAFVLEERLELVDSVMAIRTNLPAWADACAALPLREAPCADDDGDGLTDAWEALVLERMTPLIRLDEKEPLLDDTEAAMAIIGRVAPVGDDIVVSLALLYTRDYGKCGGFTKHPGDSESAALRLTNDGEAGDYRLTGAFTAAHQDENNDQSRTFTGNALAQFVYVADAFTDMPRWVVFSAVAKHATYATATICEAVNKYIPCVSEDCSPDGVPNPGDYDLRPPVANAGELEAPLLTALDDFGFPGENAWADQTFCGGFRQDGCSPGVRKRLLFNPF